jgi:hypothetical protein
LEGFKVRKIVAVGAVENVGKAERSLRSFFQAPCGNHQEEARVPYWISTGAPFSTALAPGDFSRFVVMEFWDTPSPLRINVTDC